MGNSAIVEWEAIRGDTSYFMYGQDEPNGELKRIITISINHINSLGVFIHEINECELTDVFVKFGIENMKVPFKSQSAVDIRTINITKKMVKKYSEFQLIKEKDVIVSHMISPYGISQGNCLIDRNKNRVRW
jgi:hypothetical protein